MEKWDRATLTVSYAQWRSHSVSRTREKLADHMATIHYNATILRKVMGGWRFVVGTTWRTAMEKKIRVSWTSLSELEMVTYLGSKFQYIERSGAAYGWNGPKIWSNYSRGDFRRPIDFLWVLKRTQQIHGKLDEANAKLKQAETDRAQQYEEMKRALMRGVCALNMETMAVLRGSSPSGFPAASLPPAKEPQPELESTIKNEKIVLYEALVMPKETEPNFLTQKNVRFDPSPRLGGSAGGKGRILVTRHQWEIYIFCSWVYIWDCLNEFYNMIYFKSI